MAHYDYDKLKPFGFAIHGAIDGYSRKRFWLHIGSSNNNSGLEHLTIRLCLKAKYVIPMIAVQRALFLQESSSISDTMTQINLLV